ncbi:MAG: hypothetical protein ABIR56_12740, partial [Polaromonas sp.]
TQADSGPMTSQKPTPFPSNTPDQPAAGKGLPAKEPQAQRSLPGQHETPEDGSVKDKLELPSDRDQAVDMTGGQTSPVIEQAARDINAGLKDTSKAPEMDQTYKKQKR